jgi:plastocyanin
MRFTLATIAIFATAAAAVPTYPQNYCKPTTTTVTHTYTKTATYTEPAHCEPTNKYDEPKHYQKEKRDSHYPPAATHTVVVGGDGILAYNPPQLKAKKGDVIKFEFLQLNHTLTESEFKTPCTANGDFDTGFVPNLEGKRGIFREVHVEDEKPHWYYCRQGNHCSQGMVFALNPTEENTFEKFQALAKQQQQAPPAAPPTATTYYPEPTGGSECKDEYKDGHKDEHKGEHKDEHKDKYKDEYKGEHKGKDGKKHQDEGYYEPEEKQYNNDNQ